MMLIEEAAADLKCIGYIIKIQEIGLAETVCDQNYIVFTLETRSKRNGSRFYLGLFWSVWEIEWQYASVTNFLAIAVF